MTSASSKPSPDVAHKVLALGAVPLDLFGAAVDGARAGIRGRWLRGPDRNSLAAGSHARNAVGVPETHFDEWIALRYEALWPELFDPAVIDPAVDFLADLAGTGSALELGIGTGRVALPLSRRGACATRSRI